VEESTSLEGLLRMLEKHRVDAIVADEYSTTMLARQLSIAARATDIVINGEASVFAFSRHSVDAATVERFNAALEALRRDGSLKRLESQFLQLPPRQP
jgi:ABC-type amino acid transport substrate-binding protein